MYLLKRRFFEPLPHAQWRFPLSSRIVTGAMTWQKPGQENSGRTLWQERDEKKKLSCLCKQRSTAWFRKLLLLSQFFKPPLGGTRSRAGVKQPFDYLIVQNRQSVQSVSRWIGHWRTTWSTVCPSAPHSQAAEEAIPHLYKQERKHPTPVRRRLSPTQAVLRRAIGWGWCRCRDESAQSCRVVRPLRIPLVIRPLRRMYVIVVR